jgi:arylsulfatase A-like enzyme
VATLAPHLEIGWATNNGDRNPRPAPRHHGAFGTESLPKPQSYNELDVSDKPAHIQALPLITPVTEAKILKTYRSQLESLLAVDEAVAAIINALQANGELNNTLFIFTADNGWFQGEHRIPSGKVHPYEESIRVPLILRGPGLPANTQRVVAASNVDLAPTALDAANAAAGLVVDGHSLIPLPPANATRNVLVETGPRTDGSRWYAAVRTPRFLYVEHSTGETELYDHAIDPSQLRSRHADPAYAATIASLAAELHRLQACAGNC